MESKLGNKAQLAAPEHRTKDLVESLGQQVVAELDYGRKVPKK